MNTLLKSPVSLRVSARPIRVAFIPTTVSGVAYYRLCAFAWEMRKRRNVFTAVAPFSFSHLECNPWQNDMLTNRSVAEQIEGLVRWADIIVWQPLMFDFSLQLFEDLRSKYQKPFLVEVDDYLQDIPYENAAHDSLSSFSKNYQCAISSIRQADGLIVSTPYLAKQYDHENSNIYVMPNSLDFKGLRGRPKVVGWDSVHVRRHARLRIGWIGGGSHTPDLEMVAPALSDILEEFPNVWLYVVHGCPQIFKDWAKQGRNVYWTHKWIPINLYPRALASYCFDIGIAPLVDNNFNRGKSNLRWLEYSGLKIPTVASPQPDFTRAIEHGKDGFIANDLDDWKKYLRLLIEQPSVREEVGRNAYLKVKRDFNVRKTSQNYLNLLRSLV